jgi:3-hydroxyisobutyrate dehydrogenase-like beta-hydroxyacid dehydrogenase
MKIGFVGTGLMGTQNCLNLLKHGHELVVNDIRRDATKGLEEKGAKWAATPKEIAQECRVVVMSLPMPTDVEVVVAGKNGILEGAKAGDLVVDLSTNAVSMVKKLDALCRDKGVSFLDSPVSGGVWGARDATLAIMVGGEEADFARAKPIFECIGKNIVHMGPVGQGTVAKLVNNMMGFINGVAVVEGMVLGAKAGADPDKLFQVVKASSGNSFALEQNFARGAFVGNFEPGFSINLAHKDCGLALDMARDLKVPIIAGTLAFARLTEGQMAGIGGKNTSALIQLLERVVGVEVRTKG